MGRSAVERAGCRGKQVLDVLDGERALGDVDTHARLDYLIVVGLAHGHSLEEIHAMPTDYLELLDAYHAARGLV
mgnify:CR=1 FL=1